MYENGKMKTVETVLRRGKWVLESDGGVNLTKIYLSTFVNVTMCLNTMIM
jgi:hypothetical protein